MAAATTTPSAESTRQRHNGSPLLWVAALIAASAAVFAGSYDVPFIFDDISAIVRNPSIRRLWPLNEALRGPDQTTVAGRPVVNLSLAVNHALGGLSVWGYHLANHLVHVTSSLLVFVVLRRLLLNPRLDPHIAGRATELAGAMALLWTVHPLQTETVTYTIQRTELLMGMFYLLTIYSAMRTMSAASHAARAGWTLLAITACALGMGSKEVMVSAPLLVLLYDRTCTTGSFAAALRRRPWLYAGLAFTWIILIALMLPGPRSESAGLDVGVSPWYYLLTQTGVIVHYLRLAVWPLELSVSYHWPLTTSLAQAAPAGILVLVLLSATAVALWRRWFWGLAGAWFFLILAPTSSAVPIATEFVAERRMYLPLLAPLAVIVVASYLLLRQVGRPSALIAWRGIVVLAAVALAVLSVQRVEVYRDEVRLWESVLALYPEDKTAWINLAAAHMARGEYDAALQQYRHVLALYPESYLAWSHLGDTLVHMGDASAAEAAYRRAIALRPQDATAHYNLGVVLAQHGRPEEARQQFLRAVERDPLLGDAWHNLGGLARATGDAEGARAYFQRALRLYPDDPETLLELGRLELELGQFEAAERHLSRALRLRPADAQLRLQLQQARQRQHKRGEDTQHQ